MEPNIEMRIVQLSDSHLSNDKPARAVELEACIKAINTLQPAPDAVVHTGDIAHDGKIEDYEIARQLLDQLTVPYFVLAGNRDQRRSLIQVFADGRHLTSDSAFVQYAIDDFSVRLIMIDTKNEASNKGQLCQARMQHLDRMLSADPSRPAVVFLHHPPFQVDVGPDPFNFADWSEAVAVMDLIQRHDHVSGIYAGHVHRTFETTINGLPACLVSSIASDLRWDKPNGARHDLPVFKTRFLRVADVS